MDNCTVELVLDSPRTVRRSITNRSAITNGNRQLRAKLKEIKEELRERRHQPIPKQGKWLGEVVGGFFAYHAVPTNLQALAAFRDHVITLWHRAIRRRSQRD